MKYEKIYKLFRLVLNSSAQAPSVLASWAAGTVGVWHCTWLQWEFWEHEGCILFLSSVWIQSNHLMKLTITSTLFVVQNRMLPCFWRGTPIAFWGYSGCPHISVRVCRWPQCTHPGGTIHSTSHLRGPPWAYTARIIIH
jgi:hypothetical protein